MTTDFLPSTRTIAGFAATLTRMEVGDAPLGLWQVADLERHVDRAALLADADVPEPPYWAHCWSGARVLADALPGGVHRALELGCGLGLPALAAARGGARVVCVDRVPAALAFVRASAATNGLGARVDTLAADVTTGVVGGRFDLVLMAELLYDRGAFGALARLVAERLAPGGRALLADAGRIDTRAFYAALEAVGLRLRVTEHRIDEEGWPLAVRLVEAFPQARS